MSGSMSCGGKLNIFLMLTCKSPGLCSAVYRDLFNWIFPSLVQAELDDFRTYWNPGSTKSAHRKGRACLLTLEHPETRGGINLPKETFEELRESLTGEVGLREEHLPWVTKDFAVIAENIHKCL
ncbi:hypothetical protein B0H11DRAFT_2013896, partial [Mycena galericulata]